MLCEKSSNFSFLPLNMLETSITGYTVTSEFRLPCDQPPHSYESIGKPYADFKIRKVHNSYTPNHLRAIQASFSHLNVNYLLFTDM